mgnify:CR=1 FL=1
MRHLYAWLGRYTDNTDTKKPFKHSILKVALCCTRSGAAA